MKQRVRATGAPVARERRDGGQRKLSTFIPLKIRKRGASKVVVRPEGAGQDCHTRGWRQATAVCGQAKWKDQTPRGFGGRQTRRRRPLLIEWLL
jgi:hypothetical protein